MRAVTVVSPEYEGMGREAALRFERHTGIEVDVVRCAAVHGHRVKLEVLRDAAESGWRFFFDADWWLIQSCHQEIRALLGPWLAGAPIPGTVADGEGREFGYDPRSRITSGFLVFDPTLPLWGRVLRLALELQASVALSRRDEVYLNAAAHHFGLPVRVIDAGWNWCLRPNYSYEPPQIWALHAAGHPLKARHQILHQAANKPPPPSWALDDAEMVWLRSVARFLVSRGMKHVVEFGPGVSTRALLDSGCEVTSCETNKRAFCIHTVRFQERARLALRLTRNEQALSGLDARADWCFVDGPMGSLLTDGKARWHQLAWSAARCRFIILHDSKRPGEQRSLAALKAKGWSVTDVETPRGFAIVWRECDELIESLRQAGLTALPQAHMEVT